MTQQNVSGFGSVVTLIASNTFPAGINITQFSDDIDALDLPGVRIADIAMGVNGDLIKWSRAVPLPVSIGVIPGSTDDINLQILAEANRVGQGKVSAQDVITITVTYPDGTATTLSQGSMTDAPFGKSIAGTGREKSKTYSFMMQNRTGF
jgi:hypothetical protein